MKRITLFLCALAMSAISFAQTLPPGNIQRCPISIDRNNGVACGGEFSGAEIFITFDGCFQFGGIPSFTLATEDGVIIPASEFSTPEIQFGTGGCGPNSGNVIRICTRTNIPPANFLCLTFGNCAPICDAAGGPTPILLENFLASRKGNNVSLAWKTSTEINAKEFIVQRKSGSTFVDVATIAAKNISNGSSYTYTDMNTHSGITEYRLKLVDFDRSFKTSETRSIRGLSGSTDFTIYPNPSTGTAKIALSETFEKSMVQLLDQAGRVVKSEKIDGNASTSFRNLAPGMYLIKVTNTVTGETVSKKLTVVQ